MPTLGAPRVAPPWSLRTARAFVLGCVAMGGAVLPARAQDAVPQEGSADCGAWAYLDEDEETLRVAYDGLRLGLEEANLPRVCLERWPAAEEEAARALASVLAKRPPFLAALGPAAGDRLARATLPSTRGRIPCVYVDVATSVGGRALPAAPRPPLPCGIVRAELPMEVWAGVLGRLFPGRPQPTVLLPWTTEPAPAAALRRELLRGGLRTRILSDGEASVDAILDWGPGLGETLEPFEASVARARVLRVPLLSGKRSRFGRGAAVVLVPEAGLLGRTAAELARRLVVGEGQAEPLRATVRSAEAWVDLEAAEAEGLSPPLPFLAAATRLRRARPSVASPPRAPAPPEGAR